MDHHYMKMAIDLAKSAKGQTAPNPAVGAVIVKNNEVAGFGAHLKAGEPHAERHALQMAGEKAEGAVMYVTLEPCSHYGKTPPCADAVIEAGIKKVFVASSDPNPKVAGRGIQKLKEAGVEVIEGFLKEEGDRINREFFHFIKTKKPYVTLKSATSLDGRIATKTGESKWITGEEARKDVHMLRHQNDAILVGVNTVLADDPLLTTRLDGGGRNPVRIILDRRLRTPAEAGIVKDKSAPTWIITTKGAPQEKKDLLCRTGVKIIEMESNEINITELLAILGEHEITSLLVEGGGIVNDAFLRSGEFQQVIVYLAPSIIGGSEAKGAFSGEGISSLADAPQLEVEATEQIGKDIKLILLRKGEI
ncbi:bifunctional diaminohydroxyphosphoribosylaminopyrimidine deaminase/5-amino-6-(5-phosphoribosylamino)uracil reductase RibD [Evansella clarkii]|uniref:bifunctional diaminohydroxyphosphoribosylaminopyrimidine deaminase/5-amino-6-(5-phosphoribosylamino)uracil reductase RibD n=1 Tax=Evansella clarkii TaxID=79879 RepID=UPI000B451DE7|nr:bifunctional diaminohydroxyphosphoribosylaminopyrimidine deaminase/5-amino-6-(5-phosphoribosylamino)uracil reductase RibD [Evansella clarkii]